MYLFAWGREDVRVCEDGSPLGLHFGHVCRRRCMDEIALPALELGARRVWRGEGVGGGEEPALGPSVVRCQRRRRLRMTGGRIIHNMTECEGVQARSCESGPAAGCDV